MPDTAYRAAPGNTWWEWEVWCAVYEMDVARVEYLVLLAEAEAKR